MREKLKFKQLYINLAIGGLIIIVVGYVLGVNVGNGNINLPGGNQAVTGKLPSTLNYSSVNKVYQALKDNYNGKLTEQQLENGLKHGLADSTNDPYTEYFTPQEAKAFNSELNNSFSGIGAELSKDSSGNLEVMDAISGTPADKAGLKAQDIITSINGVSTTGMSPDAAVDKIRGKAGTKVSLGILRNGSQTLNLTITRENITAPSVTTKILAGNIGYMQISTFADDTASLSQKAADQFKKDNVKGIVLDLRDDPGGELTAAESLVGHWLTPGQLILKEKHGTQVLSADKADGDAELNGIPTVVLINSGSASASEITAGALHDHNDAYLIGEKSFGKGVVQQLISFKDGSQLKVTIASWYRPDGEDIEHKGIEPDMVVKENANPTASDDAQLQAAEAYLASH